MCRHEEGRVRLTAGHDEAIKLTRSTSVEGVGWLRKPMSKYVRTDECQDVLASLEQCAFSLAQVRRSERAWKWVILSLHSALQGAMVCHLSGTEQLGALRGDDAKRWREWNNNSIQGGDENAGDPPPEPHIADARTLSIPRYQRGLVLA